MASNQTIYFWDSSEGVITERLLISGKTKQKNYATVTPKARDLIDLSVKAMTAASGSTEEKETQRQLLLRIFFFYWEG